MQFAKNGSIGVLSKKKQDEQVATKTQDVKKSVYTSKTGMIEKIEK